jgi:L-asparagine transporter-like permease
MNFIVAIAFFATAAIGLERAFYNALLPTLILLSFITLPLAIGLYFMKNESLNEHGVFALVKGAKDLTEQELKEARMAARAARDSLEAAGLFCWLMIMLVIATETYTTTAISVYLFNSVMAITPVATYLIFEGLFRILVNRGLAKSFRFNQSPFLSWLCLVILLFLIVVIGFPGETDDASIVLSIIFPASLLLFFTFRFVKNILFKPGEVQ